MTVNSKKHTFMKREGSYSTHGHGSRGMVDWNIEIPIDQLLTDVAERRKALVNNKMKASQDINDIKVALKVPKKKNFTHLSEYFISKNQYAYKKWEASVSLIQKIELELKGLPKPKQPRLDNYILNLLQENHSDVYKLCLDGAREEAKKDLGL